MLRLLAAHARRWHRCICPITDGAFSALFFKDGFVLGSNDESFKKCVIESPARPCRKAPSALQASREPHNDRHIALFLSAVRAGANTHQISRQSAAGREGQKSRGYAIRLWLALDAWMQPAATPAATGFPGCRHRDLGLIAAVTICDI